MSNPPILDDEGDYNEKLEKYFSLKSKYEEIKIKNKRNNMKQKKDNNKMNVKDECIVCGKNGGSIFIKKGDTYYGKCQSKIMCFEIELLNEIENLSIDNMYYDGKKDLEILKENIIKEKLETIFNYTTKEDSISKFKERLDEYVEGEEKFLIDKALLFDNDSYLKNIGEKEDEIEEFKKSMNDLIIDRDETDIIEFIKSKVGMHQNLHEMYKNFRKYKYKINEMVIDSNISTLVQEQQLFTDKNLEIGTNKVIKFTMM